MSGCKSKLLYHPVFVLFFCLFIFIVFYVFSRIHTLSLAIGNLFVIFPVYSGKASMSVFKEDEREWLSQWMNENYWIYNAMFFKFWPTCFQLCSKGGTKQGLPLCITILIISYTFLLHIPVKITLWKKNKQIFSGISKLPASPPSSQPIIPHHW